VFSATQALKKANKLPPFLVEALEKAPPGERRKLKTTFVNDTMILKEGGGFELHLANPRVQEAKQIWDANTDKRQILRKPFMLAKAEWGGALALEEALEKGEAWEEDGKICWEEDKSRR